MNLHVTEQWILRREQQIQPFWVHRAVIRLIKDGLIVLTPKGYMTRSRNEVRRSKGGQRCDTD